MVRANKFSAFGLAVSLLLLGVRVSQVQGSILIDTTGGWDYVSAAEPFGEAQYSSETYGQTFTATGPEIVLDSFSFWMKEKDLGYLDPVEFAAYVMRWDAATKRATGPVLYDSGLTAVGVYPTLQKLTFNTGGIPLTAGQVYVAFISASLYLDNNFGVGWVGYRGSDVYSGGGFYLANNANNFSALTSTPWEDWYSDGGTRDLAFQASFSDPSNSAVPEPSSLVILGVGAVCFSLAGCPRRRRKNA